MVPVEGFPVSVGPGEHGGQQGLVHLVVGLPAAMHLEREDTGIVVLTAAHRMAHLNDLTGVDGIPGGGAADRAVIPEVFRLNVLGPFHLPLDA